MVNAERVGIWLAIIAVSALIGGVYYFEGEREASPPEEVIQVGTIEPCIAEVPLSVWNEMNQIGVYRWVAACEEANKGNAE